jgi:hypothetical protein
MLSQSPGCPSAEPRIPRDPDPREVLDDYKRHTILRMVSTGSSRRTAARRVGCSPSTITRTALRDPDFGEQLAHALQQVERDCLRLIRTAAENGQWRATAWLLERTNPDDFAKRPPRMLTPDDVTSLLHRFVAALAPHMSQNDLDRLRLVADAWIAENLDRDDPTTQSPADGSTEDPADDSPVGSSSLPYEMADGPTIVGP